MDKIIDLRSDTLTKPSPEMRKVMFEAEVGDDVFGEDPTINRLQEEVAELFGKEDALYVPSGTMANQINLATHTQPGEEVYCEFGCHLRNYEGGAPAQLSGVMLAPIRGQRGAFSAKDAAPLLRGTDVHHPVSRLIWIENSANLAGGAIFPQENILELRQLADDHKLGMHLDGARIWNVAAATGKSEAELCEPFDSISVCLSKGMGCPVGSLVIGSHEFITRARRYRKRFGGDMRQAGIIAAAGLYALENNRERMKDDHAHARMLAETLRSCSGCLIDMETVQTNIIIFDVSPSGRSGEDIVNELKENNVLAFNFGNRIRFVTHLDVDRGGIEFAIDVIKEILH